MEVASLKVILRQKGACDIEVEVFTMEALALVTKRFVEWCEREMPDWAEIIYQFIDKIY
jgi:hypothetical protein